MVVGSSRLSGRTPSHGAHYDVFNAFAERFLRGEARFQPIVRDCAIYSCAGAHSVYDLTRTLIAEELGQAAVVDIDNLFLRNQSGINSGECARLHRLRNATGLSRNARQTWNTALFIRDYRRCRLPTQDIIASISS